MYRYKKLRYNRLCLLDIEGSINNEDRDNVYCDWHAQFRCNQAKVIRIYDMLTNEEFQDGISICDNSIIYKVGEIIESNYYDPDINVIYGYGIHYFKDREPAYFYDFRTMPLNYTGKFKCYNSNGRLILEHNYIRGMKFGIQKEWYYNGKLKSEVGIYDDKKEGIETLWDEEGKKRCEFNYINGELHGIQREWYSSGILSHEESYVKGLLEGNEKWWYESGKLKYEHNYVNDKLHGVQREWYDNGQLKQEYNYNNDKREGLDSLYKSDGYF